MPEPLTLTVAAIAVAHFVGEHALGHVIGGETHHFYRHFLERWRESRKDPTTGLPLNHDVEEASKQALRDAVMVLVMELAGRIEPKKSWLALWAKKLPGFGILRKDLFPGAEDARKYWVDALRKSVCGKKFDSLYDRLSLDEDRLHECFRETNLCQTLQPILADALVRWARKELKGLEEPREFETLARDGWHVGGADENTQPITIAHAYCLFFREHLKQNPKVFRILVADRLDDLHRHLVSLGTEVSAELAKLRETLAAQAPNDFASLKTYFFDFQQWLAPQLGRIQGLLADVQQQLDTVARGQDDLKKQQSEILVAVTTLRTELGRGNHVVEPVLNALSTCVASLERKIDHLIGGLPIERLKPIDPPTTELGLLHPKQRAVDLVGRDVDLGALWQWLTSPAPISARLLVGGAGTGKTRLAIELLCRVAADLPEWQATLMHGDDLRRLVEKTPAPDLNWPAPTLLVIDYAQTLTGPLTALFRALTHRRDDGMPRLRVLLLDRVPGQWFDDLLRVEDGSAPCAVGKLFEPATPVSLTPLPEGELRRNVLQQTLDKAAQFRGEPALKLPPEGNADYDASLAREIFAQPLNLMLAALAAEELGLLPALRRERIGLAETLADRELIRVARYSRHPHNEAQERALRHLAACATLERGLRTGELMSAAEEELKALQINWPDGPGDFAEVLRKALPDESGDLAVVPVEPDFVGEALVLRGLANADGNGNDRWERWCATVQRCSRRDARATSSTLLHALQNFGQMRKYGEPLLAATDALIRDGSADKEPDLLLSIENALPTQSVELQPRAVEVTRHLYDRLKGAMKDRPELQPEVARLANNLGVRLADAGRRTEALAPAQEAVELRRVLARQNPDAFQPDLASALNNLAILLSELGRRTEALAPGQEAVDLYRALARQNPDAFQPDLAGSLSNLANRLSELGRRTEALAPAQEAVDLCRALARQNPDAFQPDLASALNNLAILLSELGRRTEALAPGQEAVDLYRALARQNPDAFQPDLAMALNNLANRLSELGRRTEALAPAQEAVNLYRALARQNPEAFQPNLASSLSNLAIRLSELGRRTEALAPAQEAVELRRALARQNPDAFAHNLARSLGALSQILMSLERSTEAATALSEAIRAVQPHFVKLPKAFAELMAALVRDYLGATNAAHMEVDVDLLSPILDTLQRLQSGGSEARES